MPDAAQAYELQAPAMSIVHPHISFGTTVKIPEI